MNNLFKKLLLPLLDWFLALLHFLCLSFIMVLLCDLMILYSGLTRVCVCVCVCVCVRNNILFACDFQKTYLKNSYTLQSIYLFLEMGEVREKERERNISV